MSYNSRNETYLLHKDIMQFNEIEVSWELKFIGFGYLV